MALFDVLMPVKNGGAYLAQAINSVRAQTVTDWRLLVLDHGSTDGTLDIVARLAARDARIQLHPFPTAQGLAGLLNEGLALVQAPYAMRMDADDECLPQRMAATQRGFEANPSVSVLGAQALWMNAQGQVTGPMRVPCGRDQVARQALFINPFIHPAMCFRSTAIQAHSLRYGRSLRDNDAEAGIAMPSLAEDYLLFGELAIRGEALNLPDTVLRYRHHAGGISRQKFQGQLQASATVSRHLALQLTRQGGVPHFDPVPFASHGETALQVGDGTDYRDAYATMHRSLTAVGGVWSSDEGRRELAWRRVFVNRNPWGLLARAAVLWPTCRPSRYELRTVRNVVKQRLQGRTMIGAPPWQEAIA